MKKSLLALIILLPAAVQAKEMIGPYEAVGYLTCNGMKIQTSTINVDDNMVLQLPDAETQAPAIYLAKRTDDHSEAVKYVRMNYDAATRTFTPDPSGASVNFGIRSGNPGTPGNDLYHLTMNGQEYACSSYTVYNPLSQKKK